MILQPTSLDDLSAIVASHARLRVRGAGTKPALSGDVTGVPVVDLRGLAGIVEYQPDECTFTARAGTPVAEIEAALAAHGQHLPFDPPLVDAGATIGGTVAAGLSGSCRYRFGGVRDFLIGARIVDGRGAVITSGGKVVKNAAGFLVHQALVGSCGRLGVLAELTFKVFPAAEAHATLRVEVGSIADAIDVLQTLQRARFDLEALDIEAPGAVLARIGGFREAMPSRIAALQATVGGAGAVLEDEADAAVWRASREFAWRPAGTALVRVPTTLHVLTRLDAALSAAGAPRRYGVAGNLALIAWPGPVAALDETLREAGLSGQVLIGSAASPYIGVVSPNAVGVRLAAVLDPDGRF